MIPFVFYCYFHESLYGQGIIDLFGCGLLDVMSNSL